SENDPPPSRARHRRTSGQHITASRCYVNFPWGWRCPQTEPPPPITAGVVALIASAGAVGGGGFALHVRADNPNVPAALIGTVEPLLLGVPVGVGDCAVDDRLKRLGRPLRLLHVAGRLVWIDHFLVLVLPVRITEGRVGDLHGAAVVVTVNVDVRVRVV